MARPPVVVVVVVLVFVFFAFSYRFFLSEAHLSLHDTGFIFQIFKIAYSNFFFTGELPEWIPQGVFGYQTHFQNIFGLGPLSYPVMALGKLFGVLDALVLFKVVILLEVGVFGFGFMRLADEFFENRYVSLLALAPVLMTIIVINQITFMFRIVYLVPLMTVFMLGFFRSGKVWKLVMATVVVFAALFGTNTYFVIYYAIYGVVFCAAFYVVGRKNLHPVIERAGVLGAVAALCFVSVCSYLVLTSIDGLAFVVTDRDPVTLKVDLETFLNYGGGGIVKMFEMLVAAPLATLDVMFYVPAAAFVFAVYGLFRERDPIFPALVAAAAMGSAVLVERTDGGERRLVRSVAGEYPNAMSLAAEGIAITDFSANRLAATVKIAGPDGAWLVYADGFHPGRRATLNGKPLPVWKANMAFKAVFLPPGVNAVVFDFVHWGWQWAMWLVAFSSVLVIVLGSMWPIKKPEKG